MIVTMQTPNERESAELRLGPYPGYEEVFEELEQEGWLWLRKDDTFAWQDARWEASLAYSHWCQMRDEAAYSAYRAAQDRADAAQDALSLRHAAERATHAEER
jgi:hypothetical protein